MRALEIRGLSKVFRSHRGDTRALDRVSFSVRRGQAFGLVGESGSGKTTLARCVLRLEQPDQGRILFMGEDWLAPRGSFLRRRRRRMQVVFQDPYSSLNPKMRVRQLVEEPLLIHRMGSRQDRRRCVDHLLTRVGLDPALATRQPDMLSGGQRQRVAIARALAPEPQLLIADEPTSALDVGSEGKILSLLASLQREGLTVLLISHDLGVVQRVCSEIGVLYRGQLVECAPTEKVFAEPSHPYTQELIKEGLSVGFSVPALGPEARPPKNRLHESSGPN